MWTIRTIYIRNYKGSKIEPWGTPKAQEVKEAVNLEVATKKEFRIIQ